MIRPEGAGYFLAVLAALVTTKTRRKDILCFTGMFLLIFVPYFLWRFSYFGYPLPNTFYAKATLSTGRLLWGIEYLEQFMTLRLFWFVPVCMWIMFRRRGSDDLLRLASFMLAAAVIDVVIVGGDQFPFYRFFLPVMPLCLVVLVIGVVELTEFLKKRRNWPGARATTVAALVLTLYAVWTFAGSFLPVVTFSTDTGISHFRRVKETDLINRDYFVIGKYLGGKYPPSTLIALNAAGIIPYESGLRTIDMLGLNDVHIAHRPFTDFEGVSGHQKHDADYVLSKRPDLILTGLPMLETEMLSPGQVQRRVAWWSSLLPGDARLHESDIFRNEYKLEALSMNDGRWLYCYVRKQDKEHHEAGQNI